MNLLPIPALDGGRLLFLGYEAVTKKKIPAKFEAAVNNVFFILLLVLFIFVTFGDISRIFT
jgi:regulator of sigma E protease